MIPEDELCIILSVPSIIEFRNYLKETLRNNIQLTV
jgi:hypothetical protein